MAEAAAASNFIEECAICLEPCSDRSTPDTCDHEFCFGCLSEWSKKKVVCPQCGKPFQSIRYDRKSNEIYGQVNVKVFKSVPRKNIMLGVLGENARHLFEWIMLHVSRLDARLIWYIQVATRFAEGRIGICESVVDRIRRQSEIVPIIMNKRYEMVFEAISDEIWTGTWVNREISQELFIGLDKLYQHLRRIETIFTDSFTVLETAVQCSTFRRNSVDFRNLVGIKKTLHKEFLSIDRLFELTILPVND